MAEAALEVFVGLVGVAMIVSTEFGKGRDSEGEYFIAFPLLLRLDLRDMIIHHLANSFTSFLSKEAHQG